MHPAGSPAIDVVVVAYNSGTSLRECIERLRRAREVASVVVVDNGSEDASLAIAEEQAALDPRVRLLHFADNPGFATACNHGVEASSGAPWLAFVNPDCLVEPCSLARLRRLGDANPEVGLLGADLVDVDGLRDPAVRRCDPDPRQLLRTLGSSRGVAVMPDDAHPLQEVDATSGALMMLPRDAYERVGGFDAAYRLHAEDLDLCRRVREAGLRVAVANVVRVVHLRGTSSTGRPVWVEWQKHRSLQRYFRRFAWGGLPPASRALMTLAIWSRFLFAAPRAWWRARHG